MEAIAQAVAQSGRRDLLADCADLPDPADLLQLDHEDWQHGFAGATEF